MLCGAMYSTPLYKSCQQYPWGTYRPCPRQVITYHRLIITKTCPCNVYPLEPHFCIAKLGYAGVYLFFLILLQNIDCGYSLEPPRQYIRIFLFEIFIFDNFKSLCILHGPVFVMLWKYMKKSSSLRPHNTNLVYLICNNVMLSSTKILPIMPSGQI